jgi:putative intracellular protease/amidase
VWTSGGIVSALCHGSAALLQARDEAGHPVVKGRAVTGFSNEEEEIAGKQIGVPYLPFLLEDALKAAGGNYVKGPAFQSFVAASEDGRLLTGQQNFSGGELGRKLAARLARK